MRIIIFCGKKNEYTETNRMLHLLDCVRYYLRRKLLIGFCIIAKIIIQSDDFV